MLVLYNSDLTTNTPLNHLFHDTETTHMPLDLAISQGLSSAAFLLAGSTIAGKAL